MGGVVSPDRHRSHDAERTRREILAAAGAEFAEAGYAGALMDGIAARTSTSKRMIYYFGSKEGLFTAVLEAAYREIRRQEQLLNIHRGRHLSRSRHLADLRTPALAVIERILCGGRENGRMTADVDAIGMHAFISSFCVFPAAGCEAAGMSVVAAFTAPGTPLGPAGRG
ncbi:TetR family transcriptional regulator [Streptomyces fuscichromogenes]|uniref:TetR family transcriptional regulator n=1 Tax=Streptomyces fuscichromogenes TaxID=1324013 RepID=A0A917UJ61_9ACTN|nr:TetR family transcriptional regulator [Streptomyces fuscichromogenes]GGM96734.1 hypothetical protein GCM10011578_016760 [Streptomyces fuscichromogenes]